MATAAKTKSVPVRRCVGCGIMADKRLMYRVAKAPDGGLFLDRSGRKNGRGAYICRNRECLRKAMKTHGLERSLKVQIPQEVYESLEKEMNGQDDG